jgi:copper chaperone CopZ
MKFANIFVLVMLFMFASTTVSVAQSTATKVENLDTQKTIATKVKGVTCAKDLKMISASVEQLEGVSTCTVAKKGPTTTFEIGFNPRLVSEKEIYQAIQSTGSCEDPNERPYKVKL